MLTNCFYLLISTCAVELSIDKLFVNSDQKELDNFQECRVWKTKTQYILTMSPPEVGILLQALAVTGDELGSEKH